MNKVISYIWELIKVFLIALVIVLPIRYFLFQPFIVEGDSMQPNYQSGNYLIVDEISYQLNGPKRGDVIVFRYPQNPSERFIKRVIGLPGETVVIRNGKVTVVSADNKEEVLNEQYLSLTNQTTTGDLNMVVPANSYFVLGDNRANSYDSRAWGTVPKANVIGKVFVRLFPIREFSKISNPIYQF